MQISTETDASAAARRAAMVIAEALTRAVEQRGLATLALSGGSSPRLMYQTLAAEPVPWSRVHIFQVDERVVASDSDASNARHIQGLLVGAVPIPSTQWHPMPVDLPLDTAASQYAKLLLEICDGHLDVVHLGLGNDGHTASWPPGDSDVVNATALVEHVVGFRGYDRLTLTPVAVNSAVVIVWLVTGADKQSVLNKWDVQDASLPSSHVRRFHNDLMVTDVAARQLA